VVRTSSPRLHVPTFWSEVQAEVSKSVREGEPVLIPSNRWRSNNRCRPFGLDRTQGRGNSERSRRRGRARAHGAPAREGLGSETRGPLCSPSLSEMKRVAQKIGAVGTRVDVIAMPAEVRDLSRGRDTLENFRIHSTKWGRAQNDGFAVAMVSFRELFQMAFKWFEPLC
jgi:hypothetical protein